MSEQNLAIVTVPQQEWSTLYKEEDALNIGTIFPALNKPFFAGEAVMDTKSPVAKEQSGHEDILQKMQQLGFFLVDLGLYLATHETEQQAIALYHEKAQEYATLRRTFAKEQYPLTCLCVPYCTEKAELEFCLMEGPIPWEGAWV
ncbi:MAG: spore coat protein [Clostridiales bacterium]|nr:spore coat protein [Clostridiales bacterium]